MKAKIVRNLYYGVIPLLAHQSVKDLLSFYLCYYPKIFHVHVQK